MAERRVVVASKVGLHARPAALFVRAVADSGEKITIAKGDNVVDAASMLAVMTLGVNFGDEVVLSGDNEAVLAELGQIIETDLDA